jgi:5-formyltetrahydrofolate cyclo-ligase
MMKADLRRRSLEARSNLTPAEVGASSGLIAERFFNEVGVEGVRSVHTFIRIPKFNEVDTSMIYFRLWRDHPEIMTSAPRLESGELSAVPFGPETEMIESSWGIREPAGDAIDPAEIDLVVVPLLCFDRALHRVGYGKGYYDRFLARCRPDCRKVGVSLFPPVESIDDIHDGDIALDLVVTAEDTHSNSR